MVCANTGVESRSAQKKISVEGGIRIAVFSWRTGGKINHTRSELSKRYREPLTLVDKQIINQPGGPDMRGNEQEARRAGKIERLEGIFAHKRGIIEFDERLGSKDRMDSVKNFCRSARTGNDSAARGVQRTIERGCGATLG